MLLKHVPIWIRAFCWPSLNLAADGYPNKRMIAGFLGVAASRTWIFQAGKWMCQPITRWIVYFVFIFKVCWNEMVISRIPPTEICGFLQLSGPIFCFLGAGKKAELVWKEACTQVSMSSTELDSLFGCRKDPQPINSADKLKFIRIVLFFCTCSRF